MADKDSVDESFETLLARLEEIVAQLEAGERPLDESLALYESGVAALKRCHGILDKSEKRIRMLLADAQGNPVLRDAPLKKDNAAETVAQKETPEVQKKNNKSGEQNVDSEGVSPQNPPSSSKQKSKPRPVNDSAVSGAPESPQAGGSLFGSAS
jgi:exodeoxyribonuclease VII small subunit